MTRKNKKTKNLILHCFEDGSILIDISTKKFPLATSRMDKEDFDAIEGRISLGNHGYPRCTIDGTQVLVHQLVMSEVPEGYERDHKNRDRTDNRACNLRCVTHQENMTNITTNTSGHVGVYFNEGWDKWTASINKDKERFYLGSYKTMEEAVAAREAAEALLYGLGVT